MTDKQWEEIKEKLPAGAKIVKAYRAFENGELRLAVKINGECETRYIVRFNGDNIKLEHRP